MYSFNEHLLKTSSGPAGDTRMKRHSPVLKEFTVLVMSERQVNSPVSKLTALVESVQSTVRALRR